MFLHQIILDVAHVYLYPEWDFCQTMHFAEKMHLSRTLLQKILSDLDGCKSAWVRIIKATGPPHHRLKMSLVGKDQIWEYLGVVFHPAIWFKLKTLLHVILFLAVQTRDWQLDRWPCPLVPWAVGTTNNQSLHKVANCCCGRVSPISVGVVLSLFRGKCSHDP